MASVAGVLSFWLLGCCCVMVVMVMMMGFWSSSVFQSSLESSGPRRVAGHLGSGTYYELVLGGLRRSHQMCITLRVFRENEMNRK